MRSVLRTRIALFLFLTALLGAQKSWCQLPSFTFEVITSKEGLPSNTVLCATRDHLGFMWFGTRQCPVRYDGVTFKSFTEHTTNFVTGMQADEENNIWIASDRSTVSKIESNTMRMVQVPMEQKFEIPSAGYFYLDSYGQGWFSDHYGVNRIDLKTQKQKHYPLRQTTFVGVMGGFVEDRDKTLWVVGMVNGLFRYDRTRDTLICVLGAGSPEPNRFEQLVMSKASADPDGFLWIGTYNYGLIKYDPQTNGVELFNTGRLSNQIVSVEEGWDENGKRILWVGDEEGLGIFRPDQKKFYFFPIYFLNPMK